jgi:hypothetical protein
MTASATRGAIVRASEITTLVLEGRYADAQNLITRRSIVSGRSVVTVEIAAFAAGLLLLIEKETGRTPATTVQWLLDVEREAG